MGPVTSELARESAQTLYNLENNSLPLTALNCSCWKIEKAQQYLQQVNKVPVRNTTGTAHIGLWYTLCSTKIK